MGRYRRAEAPKDRAGSLFTRLTYWQLACRRLIFVTYAYKLTSTHLAAIECWLTEETDVSDKLLFLIEEARGYQMTSDEREAQVRSFAFGNTHLENDSITMDDIDHAIGEMVGTTVATTRDDSIQL